jgi:hypothetical protein
VAGGERDEVGEALEGHAIAGVHEAGDRFVETKHATAYHRAAASQAITARFVR